MFSGGKDSLAALMRLRESSDGRAPQHLLTTYNESSDRVALHGTPMPLMRAQARALGVPLIEIPLPEGCDNSTYLDRVGRALQPLISAGLTHVAFGDLFLEDIRAFRERQMQALGLDCLFPLWQADTRDLAREMIAAGVEAVICCIDSRVLDEELLGERWDEALLDRLPDGCDPCGENGEFHTLVVGAPAMHERLSTVAGGMHVIHDRFCMLDLRLA